MREFFPQPDMGFWQYLPDIGNIVNRDHPLNQGLVSEWAVVPGLDGGPKLYDLLGQNHGTLTNGPTWDGSHHPGGYGSLKFDGINDSVTTPATNAQIPTNADVTLAAWLYSTNSGVNDEWFGVSNLTTYSPNFHNTMLAKDATDKWVFNNYDGAEHRALSDSALMNQWVHVVGIRQSGTNYLYINGTQQSIPVASGTPNVNAAAKFSVGSLFYNSKGFADSLQAYNRALSASEVGALYQESLRGNPTRWNWLRPITYLLPEAPAVTPPTAFAPVAAFASRVQTVGMGFANAA